MIIILESWIWILFNRSIYCNNETVAKRSQWETIFAKFDRNIYNYDGKRKLYVIQKRQAI